MANIPGYVARALMLSEDPYITMTHTNRAGPACGQGAVRATGARRMSFVQVCLGYPPNYEAGGAAVVAEGITEELSAAGYEITIVAPKLGRGNYRRTRFISETQSTTFGTVWFCGTWIQMGFKTLNPAAVLFLPAVIRRSDVAIIHGLRVFLGTVAACTCWLVGRPYVLFPHGMAQPRWRSILIKRFYDAVIGRRILRRAAAVACLSEREREETLAVGGLDPGRVKLVRISTERASIASLPGPSTWDRATIIYLGRVVREKGIELMIDVLADETLSKRYEILVAGSCEHKDYARALVRKAECVGVELRFAGLVSGDRKTALLNGSHLLALTSEFESWGRVVWEAVQVGTPVLVTDTCGIASDVSPMEGMVVPRTLYSLRSALRTLCADDFRKLRELRGSCRGGPLANRKADVLRALTDVLEASRTASSTDVARPPTCPR